MGRICAVSVWLYQCRYRPWSPGSGFYRFLHWIFIPFPPFLYCALWKEVTVRSTHFSNGEIRSTSLRMKYLHKLFGIFLHERLVCSSSFLYLLNCLSIHYVLGYMPISFLFLILFFKLLQLGHWELFQLTPVFLHNTPIRVPLFLSPSPFPGATRCFRLIFCVTGHSPRIRHFSKGWLSFVPLSTCSLFFQPVYHLFLSPLF